MNPWFAVLAALMAGAALAFLLWPLLRKGARGMPVVLGIVLAFALPVSALALYMVVGTPAALNPDAIATSERPLIDLAAAVAQLQQRLDADPDDLEGWTLLARARQAMDEPEAATTAWQHAARLAPDNPDILAATAEAMSVSAPEHQVNTEARALLEKALQLEPDHQRGLWLLGISDYQLGRYAEAAATWQHLLGLVDANANPQVAAAIAQQIERAQAAAGLPASTGSTHAPANMAQADTAAQPAEIHVEVSLAPDLARLTDPAATVFVFAHAPDGSPMPAAIQRLKVADLPARLSLTDAMSMTPQLKLSMLDTAQVIARVSASGDAKPQTGDLESSPQTISVRSGQPIRLNIDHVLK